MLLKSTFSNTKKFFKNSLQTFKAMLSGGGYQKLPKSSPFQNPFSCEDSKMHHSFKELDSFYTDFTNRWDMEPQKAKKETPKKVTVKEKEDPKQDKSDVCKGRLKKFDKEGERSTSISSDKDRGSYNLVAQRLKELELMDVSNVDHVLDIEEVFHYYSRLTCPAYVDIIDRLFVQVYSEYLQSSMSNGNGSSRKLALG